MEKAIIITAPSGAGKSTIANRLLDKIDRLGYSVSATTRAPRPGEQEGVDYYYISREEFLRLVDEGAFVEWEEVYRDTFYGTLKREVERIWASGRAVLYVVDVVGARDLKQYFGDRALAIFIVPPSLEALRERLIKRGTESEQALTLRLDRASREMEERDDFDLVILNDDLETAVAQALEAVGEFLDA